MSIHIGGKPGDIADTVFLPGDPLRAKYIAENFLEDFRCYSEVRGMYGYTGLYQGKRVSVQGTGMGLPSLSIYVNELINEYGVKNLIRVGTCGSFQQNVHLRDIVLAMSACTESNVNHRSFRGMDFAPTANFDLLLKAYQNASQSSRQVHVGSVLSADVFYKEDPEEWKLWARHGVLGVEMETAALYTIAARFKCRALSVLTVSDNLVTSEATSSQDREKTFLDMIHIALKAI